MTEVVKRSNFFIDSAKCLQMNHCNGVHYQLNLQSAGIHASDDEYIRLVLKQFSMYKVWANINTHNNTFRILTPASANEVSLTIPSKNYKSIYDIALAFATSFSNGLIAAGHYASATIVINNPSSGSTDIDDNTDNVIDFTITTNVAHGLSGTDVAIRFYIEDGDIYEIMGGDRINSTNGVTNSVTITYPTTTTIKVTCLYHAQTTSEAYIYLRTDIQSDALETGALSSQNVDEVRTISQSQILAKIPMDRTIISYDSQTDEYFINVDTKNLTHMELRLTDSYNRELPQVTNQSVNGNLNFNCLIEIQILKSRFMNPYKLNVERPISSNVKQSGFLSALNHGDTRLEKFNK